MDIDICIQTTNAKSYLISTIPKIFRLLPIPRFQIDTQSVSSREPSYRYLTTRESAEVVRERLREQGRLAPPIREHYYSTIGNGNEYETVDGASSAYGVVPSRRFPDNNFTQLGK